MRIDNSQSVFPVFKTGFLTALLSITVMFFSGCSTGTLILENNQDVLIPLQDVFLDTYYYSYDNTTEVYKVYDDKKSLLGYAFYAEGISYDGEFDGEGGKKGTPMKILVGMEDKNAIKGAVVISHAEDYMFWQLLINAEYLRQFDNLELEDVYFTSNGGKVDCVTGATLSSLSVLDLVRESAAEKVKLIAR